MQKGARRRRGRRRTRPPRRHSPLKRRGARRRPETPGGWREGRGRVRGSRRGLKPLTQMLEGSVVTVR